MYSSFSIYRHGKPYANVFLALAAAILSALVQIAFAADTDAGALINADQREVESLALKLFNSPEVKKQRTETYKHWSEGPAAATPDGKRTMKSGVDKMAFYACLTAANNRDPAHPKLTWYFVAPHAWFGQKTPGSRIGIENPDNAYRLAIIDHASRYEITVHSPKPPGPVQYSFQLYDGFWENTKQNALFDSPIATLLDHDLKAEADGSFKITIDGDPADGRPNHLQSNPDVKYLLVRGTLSDWGKQNPLDMEIRRASGSETRIAGENDLEQNAAHILKYGADQLLQLKNNGYHFDNGKPNAIAPPLGRGGNWGYFGFANFKLADDEAFLVTLDPMGAKYLGFVLTTPWMVSREHIRANGSLNNLQAQPNNDGTYTYVISAKDPGVHNWLDTGGLHDGAMMLRWQGLPDTGKSASTAVREQKVVKLDDLPGLMPPETVNVTPGQRKEIYDDRARSYALRAGNAASMVYESIRHTPREP